MLAENWHGLVVKVRVTPASGRAEREVALAMVREVAAGRRVTLAADRGYGTRDVVEQLRQLRVTPHVAENTLGPRKAVDGWTVRHEGYCLSQRARKRVEEFFGWLKTVAGPRKLKWRGKEKVRWMVTLAAAAYNLVRMRNLMAATA